MLTEINLSRKLKRRSLHSPIAGSESILSGSLSTQQSMDLVCISGGCMYPVEQLVYLFILDPPFISSLGRACAC